MVRVNYQARNILGKSLELSSGIGLKRCSNRQVSPEDRISQLPEEILFLILSLLTLKEAVQTSVLSRRWMTLWAHASRLNFDAKSNLGLFSQSSKLIESEGYKYVAWVNRVLELHKGATLDEFRVCFELDRDYQKEIDKWLGYAFARKVKRLELNLSIWGVYAPHPSGSCDFPDRLLDLKYGTFVQQPPSNISWINHKLCSDFSYLEELCLKSLNVTDEVIKFILLKCRFLERLVVHGSGKLVNLEVSGPSLSLKYLEIKYCPSLKSITIRNSYLVSLKLSSVGQLMATNIPMLTEVQIEGDFPEFPLRVFFQLSCCLSQLKVLALDTNKLEGIVKLHGFPELTGLKELVMNVLTRGDVSLVTLSSFLKSCPNLQKFVLQLEWVKPLRESARDMEKAKGCSLKDLKVIELLGYSGSTSEQELIVFFLENAIALEKIIVDPRNQLFSPAPRTNGSKLKAARVRAKKRLKGLVPRHIELVVL